MGGKTAIALGLVAGLVVGGLIVGAVVALTPPPPAPVVAGTPAPSVPPSPSPTPAPSASPSPLPPSPSPDPVDPSGEEEPSGDPATDALVPGHEGIAPGSGAFLAVAATR